MFIICQRTKNGKIKEIFKTIPENRNAEEIFKDYCESVHKEKFSLVPVNRLRFLAIHGREPQPAEIGLYNVSTFTPRLCTYLQTPHGLKFETGEQSKSVYLSRYADQLSL